MSTALLGLAFIWSMGTIFFGLARALFVFTPSYFANFVEGKTKAAPAERKRPRRQRLHRQSRCNTQFIIPQERNESKYDTGKIHKKTYDGLRGTV